MLLGSCECGAVRYRVDDAFSTRRAAAARAAGRRPGPRSRRFAGIERETTRPTEHIVVGSKAPWFEITDDLPRFDEHVV
jgi:hypothetical protein